MDNVSSSKMPQSEKHRAITDNFCRDTLYNGHSAVCTLNKNSIHGKCFTGSFHPLNSLRQTEGSMVGSPLHDSFWDGEDSTSSISVESSPVEWTRSCKDRTLGKLQFPSRVMNDSDAFKWDDCKDKKLEDMSEMDMMKERFAKLLLGEDTSGGGKGVSSALAISNAITNLSASVFGKLWQLGSLPEDHKKRWQREIGWLISISDHIVEFMPSSQVLHNGTTTEVMITKPRSDLQLNLPALRKLDTMLIGILDSFKTTEFWYVDRAIAMAKDGNLQQRQQEKWWLPVPRVPFDGLSIDARIHLQHQRENVNQILKAAVAINAQVLSEMEVPVVYWNALPKNGRSSLGESLYYSISSENFSPEALVMSIDVNHHEHIILELVNRVEAALHIWRRKVQVRKMNLNTKDGRGSMRPALGLPKDGVICLEKREMLADRAESLLVLLRQKFPGLPQTILDMNKIQYNKDVGHSILESYSRVLESLAFTILSRIDDVLHIDDIVKQKTTRGVSRSPSKYGLHLTKVISSGLSKSLNIGTLSTSELPRSAENVSLADHMGWNRKGACAISKHKRDHRAESPLHLEPTRQGVYRPNNSARGNHSSKA